MPADSQRFSGTAFPAPWAPPPPAEGTACLLSSSGSSPSGSSPSGNSSSNEPSGDRSSADASSGWSAGGWPVGGSALGENAAGGDAAGGNAATPASGETVARDPWLGTRISDYVIEQLLGTGGMGRVYRARHQWLDMPVALKVLHAHAALDEATMNRFRREALAVARLNHPHIVRATDGGVFDNQLFLVTEYLDGCDLSSLVRQRGPLRVADACEAVCQAALALQHASQHGLVHRDIKPSNLLLTREGTIKLLDLGIARFVQGQPTLTETGHMMGTLDYMAPEQAGDPRNVDIRADIYSLGCTLYTLLAGRPPFSGAEYDTAFSKIVAHAEAEPPPLQQIRRDVPGPLARCVERMMAKRREDRYHTPADVVNALRPLADGSQLAAVFEPQPATGKATATEPNRGGQSSAADRFEDFSDQVLRGAWIALRFLLVCAGFLKRETLTVATRFGGTSTRTRYVPSTDGVVRLVMIAVVAFFLYMSGFYLVFL